MKSILCTFAIVFAILGFSAKASSAELITNGGFEHATAFFGWTPVNSPNPWRTWQNTATGLGGGFTSVGPTSVVEGTKNVWQGMTDNIAINSQWQLYQNFTVPPGRAIRVTWRDRYQINHTEFCPGGACQAKFYYVEVVHPVSGVVQKTLHTQSTIGNVNQNTGWVTRTSDVGGVAGLTMRLRFRGTETTPLSGPGQIEIDAVSIQDIAPPTAAGVSVSGRVMTTEGQGISRSRVTVTDASGTMRSALTNQFGYYRFDEVLVGETYIVSVNCRKYFFPDSPRVVTVNDELTNLNFTASP